MHLTDSLFYGIIVQKEMRMSKKYKSAWDDAPDRLYNESPLDKWLDKHDTLVHVYLLGGFPAAGIALHFWGGNAMSVVLAGWFISLLILSGYRMR